VRSVLTTTALIVSTSRRGRPSGAGSILLDAGEPEKQETAAPKAHGVGAGPKVPGNLLVLVAPRGSEDDASPQDEAGGSGAAPCPGVELRALLLRQRHRGGNTHASPISEGHFKLSLNYVATH